MLLKKCLLYSEKTEIHNLKKSFKKLTKSEMLAENIWYFNQDNKSKFKILSFLILNNINIHFIEINTICNCIYNNLINNEDLSTIKLIFNDRLSIQIFINLLEKVLHNKKITHMNTALQYICNNYINWIYVNKYLLRSDVTKIYEKFQKIILYIISLEDLNLFKKSFDYFETIKKNITSKNNVDKSQYITNFLKVSHNIFIKELFYIACIQSNFTIIDILFNNNIQILKPLLINYLKHLPPKTVDVLFKVCGNIKTFLFNNIFKLKSNLSDNKYILEKCYSKCDPCILLLFEEPSPKKILEVFEELGTINVIYKTLKLFKISKLRNILRNGIKYLLYSDIDDNPQGIVQLFYIKYANFILKSVYIEDIKHLIQWYNKIKFLIEDVVSELLICLSIEEKRVKCLLNYVEHLDISLIRDFYNNAYKLLSKYMFNCNSVSSIMITKKKMFKDIMKRNTRLELFLKCKIKNVQTHLYINSFIDDIITLFSYFSKNDLKMLKKLNGIKQSLNIILTYATLDKLECGSNSVCCSICYTKDKSLTKVKLPCGHKFHKECISESVQYMNIYNNYKLTAKCPYCTQNIFKLLPKDTFYEKLNGIYQKYNDEQL